MPKPIKYRNLIAKLKTHGIIEHPDSKRAKGSERMIIRKSGLDGKTGKYKGASYPLKCHGEGTEIPVGTLSALLRRFDIDSKKF